KNPAIARAYQGRAWGLDMYKIYARCKIVINRHGEVAKGYSNNMRLFEATGMGALLMTEDSPNIGQYFNPGSECITYKESRDLHSSIEYYLNHQEELRMIAKAGQARTLKDHTYDDILIPAHRKLIDSL